jgi:hypothetical protein
MAALGGYVASRWDEYGAATRWVFGGTVVAWLLALAALAGAGRTGRLGLYAASLGLFVLTLAGEVASYVGFSVT